MNSMCSRHFAPLLCVLVLPLAGAASAADLPKRKAGLWEVSTAMEGMPMRSTMQVCVDAAADNLMQQRGREKADCSVMDVKTAGGKVTLHSVCKEGKTTATTDAVFTGSFEAGYKGDIQMRYSPPMEGMSQMKIAQEARWLGPCKPGQKPGDVTMRAADPSKMQDMMNDPKVRELMKKQK
jgi:hypothetical protein